LEISSNKFGDLLYQIWGFLKPNMAISYTKLRDILQQIWRFLVGN